MGAKDCVRSSSTLCLRVFYLSRLKIYIFILWYAYPYLHLIWTEASFQNRYFIPLSFIVNLYGTWLDPLLVHPHVSRRNGLLSIFWSKLDSRSQYILSFALRGLHAYSCLVVSFFWSEVTMIMTWSGIAVIILYVMKAAWLWSGSISLHSSCFSGRCHWWVRAESTTDINLCRLVALYHGNKYVQVPVFAILFAAIAVNAWLLSRGQGALLNF